MRILITGSSGFVGKHLAKFLRKNLPNAQLFGVSRSKNNSYCHHNPTFDIKNTKEVMWLLDEYRPTHIIHLAANPNGRPNKNNPLEILEDNILGTVNLLENCPKNCHFINASSIVIYGNSYELHSDGNHEEDGFHPTTMYATTKANVEQWVNRYDELEKIQGLNLRFSAIIGKDMTHGFLKSLIEKLKGPSHNLELIGKSPGAQKPFLHVSDACNSILFSIKHKLNGTYNICPGDNISVFKVAQLVMEHFNNYKDIEWNNNLVWEGDNNVLKASRNKIWMDGFDFEFNNSVDAIKQVLTECSI